jgi:hypothetical protein
MKLEFSIQIFEKYSHTKFYENPSSGRQVIARGQMNRRTDMTKLPVALRNYAKTSKICTLIGVVA